MSCRKPPRSAGTIRYFRKEVFELAERRMRELCAGFATAFGVTIDADIRNAFDVLMNDPDLWTPISDAARDVVGAGMVSGDSPPATGRQIADMADRARRLSQARPRRREGSAQSGLRPRSRDPSDRRIDLRAHRGATPAAWVTQAFTGSPVTQTRHESTPARGRDAPARRRRKGRSPPICAIDDPVADAVDGDQIFGEVAEKHNAPHGPRKRARLARKPHRLGSHDERHHRARAGRRHVRDGDGPAGDLDGAGVTRPRLDKIGFADEVGAQKLRIL